MAGKTFTKEDVTAASAKAAATAEAKTTKVVTKTAQEQLKAEIDRVKQSDLGKAEQKAAIAALKNVQASLKSPIG